MLCPLRPLFIIYRGEQWRVREKFMKGEKNPFRSSPFVNAVINKCNFHYTVLYTASVWRASLFQENFLPCSAPFLISSDRSFLSVSKSFIFSAKSAGSN